jgi:hypothetical protein
MQILVASAVFSSKGEYSYGMWIDIIYHLCYTLREIMNILPRNNNLP